MWHDKGVEVHRKPKQASKFAVTLTAATKKTPRTYKPLEVSGGEGKRNSFINSY
jgi:hypothetical protein